MTTGKLSDRGAKGLTQPGKHADGGGLYLEVTPTGAKYWRMKYRHGGKERRLAFGVYPEVSLAKAREQRDKARELLGQGTDPGAARQERKQAAAVAAANTFEAVARAWMEKKKAEHAPTTRAKIMGWLEKDVFPFIGAVPVGTIKPRDVLTLVLERLERRGAVETAHRVKGIIGMVLRFAVVSGLAERDATGDLRGALAKKEAAHHPAITDPQRLGGLLRAIHGYEGNFATVAALKLAPLVFVRPGELRQAEWSEVDLQAGEWCIPGAKMKMRADHVVPLSTQAATILTDLQKLTGGGRYVFPNLRRHDRCMSGSALNAALRAMGYDSDTMTAHGFRATARTILDEVLGERVDLIEHQLAHMVKDSNGRAYNRTAHLPARREMMQRWADYLDSLRAA